MYDIIGDIHGHADELVELLEKLGYKERAGVFQHPERRVIFCGDFVDRGPRIRDTIQIARSMCEAEAARAVMGNHELNALAIHTPHPEKPDAFLRPRTDKNLHQHQATMNQLDAQDLTQALEWFRTLPVSIDLGALRVVHACWDSDDLRLISQNLNHHGKMTPDFLYQATQSGHPLFTAIERVMKGPEMMLPEGCFMVDKEGNKRRSTRIRWFEPHDNHNCATYSIPALQHPELMSVPVPRFVKPAPYAKTNPPVFIGHYWLPDQSPTPLSSNIACVDYSVAKNGMLTAYRHSGESVLQAANFVTVPARA